MRYAKVNKRKVLGYPTSCSTERLGRALGEERIQGMTDMASGRYFRVRVSSLTRISFRSMEREPYFPGRSPNEALIIRSSL